ncbi:MAG TPA: AraC family transcriptional regulator [Pedobacter sp.]|jgi:AraC-like DNA-binding protein
MKKQVVAPSLADSTFEIKFAKPDPSLGAFVENIGMFSNLSDKAKEITILPDGRIDLFFWKAEDQPFQIVLNGLETAPEQRSITPQTVAFVISFKPLAVEYILNSPIAGFLNHSKVLPDTFWDFSIDDLADFNAFYKKISQKVAIRLPAVIDARKSKLFDLIYESRGEMSVKQLSEESFWTSRQINRYFNEQLGLSLKSYCSILRFRASLEHITNGKLSPELNFSDQNHFIKEIKRLSGVLPKTLSKNENDRFVLLSVLKQP